MEGATTRHRFVQSDGDGATQQAEFEPNPKYERHRSTAWATLPKILVCVMCGLIFGFASEKGQGAYSIPTFLKENVLIRHRLGWSGSMFQCLICKK